MSGAWLEKLIPGFHERPKDQDVRLRTGTVGSVTGIAANLLLAASKAAAGLLMGSVAVVADAVNNLSDAAGSVMALVTMRLAQKPVDREHPFGHGRMEYIGALGIGMLILIMSVELFHSALDSLLNPKPVSFSWWMLIILAAAVGVKGLLWRFYTHLGRQVDSAAMLAVGKDALSDMFATSAVLLCMVAAPFTSLPLDGVMGLVVAALVFRAGFGVCRDMLNSLLGQKPDRELGRQIIFLLQQREGILGTHDLMVHDYGPGRCVASIHAEVSADMNIMEAHEIVDQAEMDVSRQLNIPLCIHMDPIVTNDEETNRVRTALSEFLHDLNPEYKMHDLRRVPGEKQINLVFDVMIPADQRDTAGITEQIQRFVKTLDPRYNCVIHYDIDYFNA